MKRIEIIDKQIDELFNHITNLDKIIDNLQKEAKIKIFNGDRNKAKKIIIKKQAYLKQIKYLKYELKNLEQQSFLLNNNTELMIIAFEEMKNTCFFGSNYNMNRLNSESIREDSENEDDIERQLKELENEIIEENGNELNILNYLENNKEKKKRK